MNEEQSGAEKLQAHPQLLMLLKGIKEAQGDLDADDPLFREDD